MFYNDEMNQDYGFRPDGDIDINITNQNMNSNTNMNMNNDYLVGSSCPTSPIVEAGRERCMYRNIYHEVPQDWVFM